MCSYVNMASIRLVEYALVNCVSVRVAGNRGNFAIAKTQGLAEIFIIQFKAPLIFSFRYVGFHVYVCKRPSYCN